jgi:glycosyltransferase involved in cell wall biosynthesis
VHVALARRAGARVLLHLHASGFEHLWSRRIERLHISRTLAAADGVAVLSAGQRTRLIELGLPADRTFVIPNGVEVPARAPLPRRDVTEDAPLRLLLVGSVEQRKGLVELLEALAVVRRERGPRVRVDVLGPAVAPPAELHRWRTRGQEVGLRMLGPVSPDEIAERLAASDGLVLPSHAEGLPFVLLEAMAATRPVLASRVGAIPELLEGAGELVEPGSVSELTGALLRWVDDPDRRADLAVRGWRRVRDSASTEVCAAAVFEAWAGTLRSGSGAEALELLSRPTREAQSR